MIIIQFEMFFFFSLSLFVAYFHDFVDCYSIIWDMTYVLAHKNPRFEIFSLNVGTVNYIIVFAIVVTKYYLFQIF